MKQFRVACTLLFIKQLELTQDDSLDNGEIIPLVLCPALFLRGGWKNRCKTSIHPLPCPSLCGCSVQPPLPAASASTAPFPHPSTGIEAAVLCFPHNRCLQGDEKSRTCWGAQHAVGRPSWMPLAQKAHSHRRQGGGCLGGDSACQNALLLSSLHPSSSAVPSPFI